MLLLRSNKATRVALLDLADQLDALGIRQDKTE